MRLLRPSEAELFSLFSGVVRNVWVCSPWISSRGVQYWS
jgi:hypothetical protein